MRIQFENGPVLETADAASVYDLAAEGVISREVIAAQIGEKVVDLTTVVSQDASIRLLTFADEEGQRVFNHTASHILAQAIKRLYPATKLAIGPAIENGFYYDFDSEISFTPEILTKLEGEMKKIVKENLRLERLSLPRDEAVARMEAAGEPYKVQLISRVPEGEEISFYRQGEFTDLCAGAHLFSTGLVKAFKLTSCTGAYWEGNSNNKMLQRIYGTAFPKKEQLNAYLAQVEQKSGITTRSAGNWNTSPRWTSSARDCPF